MKRLTDKELHDTIYDKLFKLPLPTTMDLIAYAQLRALERLADNVHVLNETLSVILADLVKRADLEQGRPAGTGLTEDEK